MQSSPKYKVVLHHQAFEKTSKYFNAIKNDTKQPGPTLKEKLKGQESIDQFIQALLNTKKPCMFAESQRLNEWSRDELSILGDISITAPVTIYDNGNWDSPTVHNNPFNGHLLFTPGPLLKKGPSFPDCRNVIKVETLSNLEEAFAKYPTSDGEIKTLENLKKLLSPNTFSITESEDGRIVIAHREIDQEKYNELLERRLLPIFTYANENAKNEGHKAVIALADIGCGVFAGKFQKVIGGIFEKAIVNILQKHGSKLSNIALVQRQYGTESSQEIEEIKLKNTKNTPGLLNQASYWGEEFKDCVVYKVVAWDHVSWPGNDFYLDNSRSTDDGVSAAATNICQVMTNVQGEYDQNKKQFLNSIGLPDWEEVIKTNKIKLIANEENIVVLDKEGKLVPVSQYLNQQQNQDQTFTQFVKESVLSQQHHIG